MLEFRTQLTSEEITHYNLDKNPNIEWYWVTVNEEDLKNKIHRYIRAQPSDSAWDWHKITSETCLARFAKALVSMNFQCNDNFLQEHVNQIKVTYENLDVKKLLEPNKPWQYIGHGKDGPFMIWDGVHRQTAVFIYYFIKNSSNFEPVQHAVCGLTSSTEGDLGRVPTNFCD